jgi:hypothetical protein
MELPTIITTNTPTAPRNLSEANAALAELARRLQQVEAERDAAKASAVEARDGYVIVSGSGSKPISHVPNTWRNLLKMGDLILASCTKADGQTRVYRPRNGNGGGK